MPSIPPEPEPFFKWDPDGHNARARATTRATVHGEVPPSERAKTSGHAVKRWLLRWAWLLSTGVLIFGYVVLVAVLTDHASWLGA